MSSKFLTCLQTLGLLPAETDAAGVARFLRCCPGLNKQTIGELLGEHDEFFLEVLRHFTDTFDFTGHPPPSDRTRQEETILLGLIYHQLSD